MLRRLEWTVLRRLDGLLHGDYRTLFRGFGLDLADLREYQYHDDVRHIDWNVTARLQTPYVREYNEDRDVTAWFLLDVSPSVDFGSGDMRKRSVVDRLRHRARAHPHAPWQSRRRRVLRRDDGHGDSGGQRTAPRAADPAPDAAAAARVAIDGDEPERLPARGVPGDLAALDRVRRLGLHQRGAVGPTRSRSSRSGTRSLAVRLYDPLENELPDLGLLTMQDAETGEQLFVDTHDRGFRKRFAKAAETREAALRAAFRHAGVDALELSTDDDLADAILRFADMRKRRSQLAAGGRPAAHFRNRAMTFLWPELLWLLRARPASSWARTCCCCAGRRSSRVRYASLAMVRDAHRRGQPASAATSRRCCS